MNRVFTDVSFSSRFEWVGADSRDTIAAEDRELESIVMRELSVNSVTLKGYKPLESLEENLEFEIAAMGQKQFRNKSRYIFCLDVVDGFIVSNYWFEKIYTELDKNIKLNVSYAI